MNDVEAAAARLLSLSVRPPLTSDRLAPAAAGRKWNGSRRSGDISHEDAVPYSLPHQPSSLGQELENTGEDSDGIDGEETVVEMMS